MRVNIYAEEMTDRVEIISKEVDGQMFTGLRIYLYMPVTTKNRSVERQGMPDIRGGTDSGPVYSTTMVQPEHIKGPFIHREGDDDSSAVTFWGKQDLRELLKKALTLLDEHYSKRSK